MRVDSSHQQSSLPSPFVSHLETFAAGSIQEQTPPSQSLSQVTNLSFVFWLSLWSSLLFPAIASIAPPSEMAMTNANTSSFFTLFTLLYILPYCFTAVVVNSMFAEFMSNGRNSRLINRLISTMDIDFQLVNGFYLYIFRQML